LFCFLFFVLCVLFCVVLCLCCVVCCVLCCVFFGTSNKCIIISAVYIIYGSVRPARNSVDDIFPY